MTDAFRGLYRTIDGAYVTNGMMAFHVPEADYRAFGYEPDFDSLPWKERTSRLIDAMSAFDPKRTLAFTHGLSSTEIMLDNFGAKPLKLNKHKMRMVGPGDVPCRAGSNTYAGCG